MSRKLHVEVDTHTCVGSSWCVNLAPGAFRIGPDGKAMVLDGSGTTDDEFEEAADSCPVSAISVHARPDEGEN